MTDTKPDELSDEDTHEEWYRQGHIDGRASRDAEVALAEGKAIAAEACILARDHTIGVLRAELARLRSDLATANARYVTDTERLERLLEEQRLETERFRTECDRMRAGSFAAAAEAILREAEIRESSDEEDTDPWKTVADWLSQQASQGAQQPADDEHGAWREWYRENASDWDKVDDIEQELGRKDLPPYETAPRLTKGVWYRVVSASPAGNVQPLFAVGHEFVANGYEALCLRESKYGDGWYELWCHGYHRVVRVEPEKCERCGGVGSVDSGSVYNSRYTCLACKGTGEKPRDTSEDYHVNGYSGPRR